MNYYTEIVPENIAYSLKEHGFNLPCRNAYHPTEGLNVFNCSYHKNPKDFNEEPYKSFGCWCSAPLYAEVFDWLMEKGIRITLHTYPAREPFAWGYRLWSMDGGIIYDPNPAPETMKLNCQPTWHKAVNAAIEKALTLI